MFASDVNALGLPTAQGLTLTETWYWDMNDANRAWTKRWQEERKAAGKFPTMIHAGVYAGILHYLKARVALGGNAGRQGGRRQDEGDADRRSAVRQGHDPRRRPQAPSDAYLFEVKKPAESKYPGDFYTLQRHDPGRRRRSARSRTAAARWSSG